MHRVAGPLIATIVALTVARLWTFWALPGAALVEAAVLLVVLVAVARWAGLDAADLALGRASWARGARWGGWILIAALVVFAIALLLPWARDWVAGSVPADSRSPWMRILVTIPLGTVVVEEFAFRGLLWALLCRRFDRRVATLGSALLFGLWHVPAAVGGGAANATLDTISSGGSSGSALRVLATVVFTAAVGVVFAELRARSESLLPSMVLHFASNSLGVAFVAMVAG